MITTATRSSVWSKWFVFVTVAAIPSVTIQALDNQLTFGTLQSCDDVQCRWTDRDGVAVTSDVMVTHFLQDERIHEGPSAYRRRMEEHVEYLETVRKHAMKHNWAFSYAMGVNSRHLYHEGDRSLSPVDFVQQEHEAAQRQQQRRLTERPQRFATSTPEYRETLNWCSPDNSRHESICTDVKSQNQCGSCWAFAAADSIETAVAVNAGTKPQSLSPQQFLDCSSRVMTATFDYCWAEGGVDGASWLQSQMIWGSRNDACNGGMTHAAFADAAQLKWSLLSQLSLPYNELETPSKASSAAVADVCNSSSTDNAAASISGWEQVVGPSCKESSDSRELLKLALQRQPVSVAINSGGSFDAYKGGIYACPNDGSFASSAEINHAVVLVGYGSDGTTDYWIIKNSYGASWGEKGFLRLAMDSKINCGLSVFAVMPTGATVGPAQTTVDGGGRVYFVGMTPESWIILGSAVGLTTGILTLVGAIYASRQRNALKEPM
uniref:Peptidase C1A papain C-terminal domain-containing protein n=1 Tax=Peronospora matthiolae TaxID=2874970 RepID=A0AAV1VM54_9STRA